MDYKLIEQQILDALEKTRICVFASANKQGEVSTASMCLVNDGLKVYVQTDKNFEKTRNVEENSNVAISFGVYNFKGIAKIVGHPTSNPKFIEKIKQKHLNTYNSYTNLPNEVLIEVELTQCKIWGNDNSKDIDSQESILVVDIKNKKVETIICDKM